MGRHLERAERDLDFVRLAVVEGGNDVARDHLAVDNQRLYALRDVARVLDADLVGRAAEHARHLEAVPRLGNAWIDFETLVRRAHTEDVLGGCLVAPRSGPREPAVAADTELRVL